MNHNTSDSKPSRSIVTSFLVISVVLMTDCGVPSEQQAPVETAPTSASLSEVIVTNTVAPSPTLTPALEPLPVIASTFEESGRNLTLQSADVKVVFDKYWGGVIREIWLDGENMINNYDGGRLLGVSFYDGSTTEGSTGHPNDTGWNPTPSDMFDNVNEPLEYSYSDNEFHLKARFDAVWEMIVHYAKVKGQDVRQLRLQRSVTHFQRSQR